MMTFKQFSEKIEAIPASTSWYLADLSEARGRQELFTRQAKMQYGAAKRFLPLREGNKKGNGNNSEPPRVKTRGILSWFRKMRNEIKEASRIGEASEINPKD